MSPTWVSRFSASTDIERSSKYSTSPGPPLHLPTITHSTDARRSRKMISTVMCDSFNHEVSRSHVHSFKRSVLDYCDANVKCSASTLMYVSCTVVHHNRDSRNKNTTKYFKMRHQTYTKTTPQCYQTLIIVIADLTTNQEIYCLIVVLALGFLFYS